MSRMDIQELIDRQEISDLLTRYAKAVDSKDWPLWQTVFTADAYIDYRATGGADGDVATMARWLEDTLSSFPMTMHYITNIDTVVDGDSAQVRAMFFNPIQFVKGGGITYVGGYYNHELVRTADGWRSRRLVEDSSYFANPPAGR